MDVKTSDWRPGPTVCRCCLTEGCYKDISTEYFWMGKREVYAEMLSETLNVSIAYSQSTGPNSNSRLICEPCISRLRDATDFRRQVLECEKTFMQHLDPGSSSVQKELRLTHEDVKLEKVKQEKRQSDDEDFDDRVDFVVDNDDDDDDLDDEPLMKLASKVPKKEVDLMKLLDSSQITVKRKATTKSKEPPTKKTKKQIILKPSASKAAKPSVSSLKVVEKKKKGIIQESDSHIILKDDYGFDITLRVLQTPISLDDLEYEETGSKLTKKLHKNKETIMKTINVFRNEGKSNYSALTILKEPLSIRDLEEDLPVTINFATGENLEVERKTRKVDSEYKLWKQHTMTLFQNSFVYPFIHASNKYKCFICGKLFLEPYLLKKHTVEEHTLQDMDRELDNKARNMILKVDVTYLQCAICSDFANNIQDLKSHINSHGKPIDLDLKDNLIPFKLGDEIFQCQVCGESYLKLRLLVIHMNGHFSNFSCEICGTAFTTHRLLKCHLEIHKSGIFPCEKCDKVFSNTAKKNMHVKVVHLRQLPRRCPLCPERFNSSYQRTKHMRIVHNRSTGLFRCESCGKEFDLRYHLLIHQRMVHLQEKNHECSICQFRFFAKSLLTRHMLVHTGEKNFKCGICGKAYSRRRNLMEHCKGHEVVQSCTVCGRNCEGHASLASI